MQPINGIRKWLKNTINNYMLYVIIWYIVTFALTFFLNNYLGTSIDSTFSQNEKNDWLIYPIHQNMYNNRLFLVAWFLISYSISTSLFKIQISLLQSYTTLFHHKFVLLILGLLAGYASITFLSPLYQKTQYWFYNLSCQIGVGYMFISIGYFVRPFLHYLSYIHFFLLSVVIMFTFSGNSTFVPIFMAWSDYPNGFVAHLFGAVIGCISLFSVAYIFSKSDRDIILQSIGFHSKDIMTLHLTSFVLVDLMLAWLGYYDYAKITGNNNLRTCTPNFWAIYICFGLFFPILVRSIIEQLKLSVHHTKKIITSQ